tara:strand:+ start:7404 stop:7544 length:141 start_codon:yes stop_codon:yes gene_type:complete
MGVINSKKEKGTLVLKGLKKNVTELIDSRVLILKRKWSLVKRKINS